MEDDGRRYLNVAQAEARYGPRESAFRKWIANGQLGSAVVRAGRLVFLDALVLDKRLLQTGNLLVAGAQSRLAESQHSRRNDRAVEDRLLKPAKHQSPNHARSIETMKPIT